MGTLGAFTGYIDMSRAFIFSIRLLERDFASAATSASSTFLRAPRHHRASLRSLNRDPFASKFSSSGRYIKASSDFNCSKLCSLMERYTAVA